jgi:hypothetical protein
MARLAAELRKENARLRAENARQQAELENLRADRVVSSGCCSGGRRSGLARSRIPVMVMPGTARRPAGESSCSTHRGTGPAPHNQGEPPTLARAQDSCHSAQPPVCSTGSPTTGGGGTSGASVTGPGSSSGASRSAGMSLGGSWRAPAAC